MGNKNINIELSATLPFTIKKRKKWYLASCTVVDIHSQGETEKEAKDNLIEALTLFFMSCFERGTLDNVLKDCGLKPGSLNNKKKTAKDQEKYITVPIPFKIIKGEKVGCHV